MPLRSPLLRAYTDWTDHDRRRIVSRRRSIVAGVFLLAVGLTALVRYRLVPPSIRFALYWLHDYIALPFWGYAFSFFAPYSVIWWSLAAILFVIWLATFLTRRSVIRRPHARLASWVIRLFIARSDRSERHVARLTAWVDWLGERKLGAELLKDVVRFEQSHALVAIVARGTADEVSARRLVRLTDLLTRLMSGAGSSSRARWSALAAWHHALMWIDRRSASLRADVREALFADLAKTGTYLLARLPSGCDLPGSEDPGLQPVSRRARSEDPGLQPVGRRARSEDPGLQPVGRRARSEDPGLQPVSRRAGSLDPARSDPEDGEDPLASELRQDLERLVAYAASNTPDERAAQVSAILLSSAGRLDDFCRIAEHAGAGDNGSALIAKTVDEDVVEVFGVLTSSIGLHAAWLAGDVHLAMAWLQAFEALSFVQHWEDVRIARGLTAEAPQRDHYRFAAEIAEAHASALDSAPGMVRAMRDEVASHHRIVIESLYDAAGPDFDRPGVRATGTREGTGRWRSSGRDLPSRIRHRLQHRPIPFRRRVDPIMIAGSLGAAALYAIGTAVIVLLFGSNELGSWSARSLVDHRILENVRRDLDARPFLDAIFHAPDRQLVVSQAGGTFHSFDPDTALWTTARPFGPRDLAHPDVRLLASSPNARTGSILWGVTADGGLVRRESGRWEIVVSDLQFIGSRGTPVQHADLSAVAVSPHGRWLVVGAGANGVGIQDSDRRRWLAPEEIAATDRLSAVTHAAWWRDRFYVGGPEGVAELALQQTPIAFRRVKDLTGSVVGLEATPADGLFVLQKVTCGNGPKDCTRLSVVTQPLAQPTVLIDERNRYPELSLDKTFHVAQWKDHLVLAGASGIFDYDTQIRSWKRPALDTITAVGPCKSASCFYFGYGGRTGGVGLFTPKTLTGESPVRWSLPGEQPVRIAARASGPIAVLTATGRAYVLGPGTPPNAIQSATSSAIAPDRFRNAVTFGDKVLFFGAPGALLHDVSKRDYRTLTAVPEWLRSPDAIVRTSGEFLFGLEPLGRSYAARVVPQIQVELGTLVLNTAKPAMVEGPIRAVDASSRDVLRVVDGSRRVLSIGPSGIVPLTGGRVEAMARARPLDVAASADGLAVATADGVRVYSHRSRSWTDAAAAPPGEHVVEIAQRGADWVARTESSRLVSLGAKPSTMIGGTPAGLPTGPLTDALARGSDLYVAWAGGIGRYDTHARGIASLWPLDSDQPVRLHEIVGGEPVSLAAGVARIGTREIARGVHSVFAHAANLWLTREDRRHRYLEVRSLASLSRPAPACLFRNPTAGAEVTELRDARPFPNGLVAVTTNAGLRLYSRQQRSWYGVASDLRADTGRGALHTLGSTLLIADPVGDSTLVQIARSAATLPDSCSTGPARFERPPEVVTVRSLAVDERGKRAVVLRGDGAVDELTDTRTVPLLSAPVEGPREIEMIRAWHFPDVAPSVLWVTTSRHVWQYDLTRHTWFKLDVEIEGLGAVSADMSIDLQPLSDAIAVIGTPAIGTLYGDSLPLQAGERRSILLRPLGPSKPTQSVAPIDRRPPSPVFAIGAVTFFREIHRGMVAVIHTEDGRSLSAYRDGRFLWDSGRRGISITSDGILIQSDAGIHPLRALTSFDSGPPGPTAGSDRLEMNHDLVPRFFRANRAYRRKVPGVWDPIANPTTDTPVFKDDETEWVRRNGVITVESLAGGRRTTILTQGDGPGLTRDRLVDAAPYGGRIFVLSQEFLEIAEPSAAGLPLTPPERQPAPSANSLERLIMSGHEGLWLTSAGSVSAWNPERRTFEPTSPEANPYKRRLLTEVWPLRFLLEDGAVNVQLRTEDLQGNTSWLPIEYERGRFAFDVVRSVATSGTTLYVGTDAGLQAYDGANLWLEHARFIALDARPNGTAVDRLGEPCHAAGTFVACSRTGCFQQSSQRFVATASADPLACRIRVRSPLWSWTADASGVTGRYMLTPASGAASALGPTITLDEGQFPHDAITQMVAFDSKLFTVWQDHYVGVHGADLRLTPETRNHQFTDAVRLVAVTDRVPMQSSEREIGPALYAFEGTRAWRYSNARWVRVDEAAEIATVADYDANRPILQRRRLRLVHRGRSNALTFEMRMPGAEWRPMAWDASANRFAIDVWQNIEVSQDTLWIATPVGLLGRDGKWTFDPNTFRFVDAVAAEAGRVITDLRIEGNIAELRYDGDSSKVYRVVLDERLHPGRFTRRDGRDPFAEQAFAVDTRYWTWGLTGRVGTSMGRLAAAWKGEPIGIVNGRFDFDTVNSMAVFRGQLHVATTTRGWFESPVASAALDRLARPYHPSIAAVDVTMLQDNRDPSQHELCLKEPTGQFARVSESGATRRTQGCPVLAAETNFWRYTRDAASFRITAPAGSGRRGERRLEGGRFTDEVVIGPPVAGLKNGRSLTLVPTSAGVMWWDGSGRTVDMQAPPFQGKPQVPRLLQWVAGNSPAYVADGTLYSLEVDEKPLAAWTTRLPENGVFERLGGGPDPLLWFDWSNGGRRHHSIIDPRNNSVSHDELPVDARRVPAYFRRAMSQQGHDGLIRLRLRRNVIQAYAGSDGWPIVEVDDSFQLLAGSARGTRAILVGPHHLIELNMDLIARAVYSGEAPPDPKSPAAPKKGR